MGTCGSPPTAWRDLRSEATTPDKAFISASAIQPPSQLLVVHGGCTAAMGKGDNSEPSEVELKTQPPHTRSAAEVVIDVQSDTARGLTTEEAARRLAENGPNELRGGSGVNFWKILIKNVLNAMNFVLAAAVALSAVAGDIVECIVVAVIIVANTAISVAQEYRSEQTLDALRRMSSPIAHVLRDGEERDVPAVQVVVGDIIVLREGVRSFAPRVTVHGTH